MSHSKNVEQLQQWVEHHFQQTVDFTSLSLQRIDRHAKFLYLKTVVDSDKIQSLLINPFYEFPTSKLYTDYLQSLPVRLEIRSKERLLVDLTRGAVLVIIEEQLFFLEVRKLGNSEVQKTEIEPTIHGPHLGLSENLEVNLNIIRQRYHRPSLTIQTQVLKEETNKTIAIIYDQEKMNPEVLQKIQQRLDDLSASIVHTTGDLQLYLNSRKMSLFPISMLTERPDRMVHNLADGKVLLLVDGSQQAIIAPVVFYDFMVSMEDAYHVFWISFFTILLRYAGLITCIVLPGLYVAVTSFTPDVFRIELALTVAGSRVGVPYPSFIEVLFMLIFIELLTEASIRLPKAVSATATTVGGLILGTAAVEAALASNIMIIVVSLVAISTFVIPINEMGFSIRICRFFILLYSSIFGLAGLALGFIGIILYLANRESFGQPYLKMFWKNRIDELKVSNK